MPLTPDPSSPKKRGYVPSGHPGRALFRVEFPFGQRPTMRWAGMDYEVLDISERGLRVSVEKRPTLAAGTVVRAMVKFDEGSESVAGTVLRGNDREAVFTLKEGFSLERIRREERRLIRAMQSPSDKDKK